MTEPKGIRKIGEKPAEEEKKEELKTDDPKVEEVTAGVEAVKI